MSDGENDGRDSELQKYFEDEEEPESQIATETDESGVDETNRMTAL